MTPTHLASLTAAVSVLAILPAAAQAQDHGRGHEARAERAQTRQAEARPERRQARPTTRPERREVRQVAREAARAEVRQDARQQQARVQRVRQEARQDARQDVRRQQERVQQARHEVRQDALQQQQRAEQVRQQQQRVQQARQDVREDRRDLRQDVRQADRDVRQDHNQAARDIARARADVRQDIRQDRREASRDLRQVVDNRVIVRRDDPRFIVLHDRRPQQVRRVIVGCPPGLAKRGNGCVPPGLDRRPVQVRYDYPRYDWVWRASDRRDRYDWRYNDGYVYRYNPQGSVLGYLPVLGGALWAGNPWPTQYVYEPAPTYYVSYYDLPDRYSYRYADGVMYGVDPQTQAIQQIAALLTGQDWSIGQAMPVGYDVYNVPYAYRTQYVDTPDRWYRYNDGYVYQVDPTTRLVQAAVQLIA